MSEEILKVIPIRQGWGNGKQAAKYLGVTQPTFYRLLNDGVIKGYKPEGARTPRYNFDELDKAMMDDRQSTGR